MPHVLFKEGRDIKAPLVLKTKLMFSIISENMRRELFIKTWHGLKIKLNIFCYLASESMCQVKLLPVKLLSVLTYSKCMKFGVFAGQQEGHRQ